MSVEPCIPIIPSKNIEKSLRFWVDGLGFEMIKGPEMLKDGKLIFCMIHKGDIHFMLNERAGTPIKPENYEGIRLYWAPSNIHESRQRLKDLGYPVSDIDVRDYGQTEFFATDDDGFSHCFGVATKKWRLRPTTSCLELRTQLRLSAAQQARSTMHYALSEALERRS